LHAQEVKCTQQQDRSALAFGQVRAALRGRHVRSCACRWRRGMLTRTWEMWCGEVQTARQTKRDSATLQVLEQQQQRDVVWRDSVQAMQREWGHIEGTLQGALAAQARTRHFALKVVVRSVCGALLRRQWSRWRLHTASTVSTASVELASRRRQVGIAILLHALFSNRCRQLLRYWTCWRQITRTHDASTTAREPMRDMHMFLVPFAPVCLICSGVWDRWNGLLGDVLPLDRSCVYLYQGIQLGQIAPDAVSAAQSASVAPR
jgi:hypothetical protein